MRHARVFLVIVLALVLLTTACSTQTTGAEVPESTLNIIEAAANFIPELNLPAVEITYDDQGIPSIFGLRATDIQRFTGIDLSFLQLPESYIDWFVRSNLQHIEIQHTQNGLLLYANGQLLPSIGWSAESLDNAAELADMLGVQNTSVIKRLVPVLQRLGLDVVLRFPVAPGNALIERHAPGVELPALADVEQPSAVVHLAVEYREDGLPTIMGLTSRDIAALTGMDLSFIELPDYYITFFKTINLQNVEIETHADGLRIFVNGKELPRLAYSPEQIDALVSLYGAMYPGFQPSPEFLKETFMMLQQADLDLIVQFPLASEAKRIPLHDGQVIGN
ncbi:MAG: hypothetical protein D6791_18250 [Chloroflexi bacterium]|nr:MAG: hypothetical protein D6791_18250 [Chloroflexota bacterium]